VRLIERLEREGVSDFRLNLHHIPDSVEAVFRTPPWDALPVSFSYESEILGTAGGLKANESFFSECTFLMANADIVMDFPLQEALDFHREHEALATMILYPQKPPFRYFPMRIDQDGRIRDFKGMCLGGDLRPETYVFTGVHILEPRIFDYIPEAGFCEINDEAYRTALAKGEMIFGYPVEGYWNDLGDPARYLEAQKDLLLRESMKRHTCISPDAQVAESAVVGPFVSAGKGCVIEPGGTVENSILWEDVRITSSAVVRDCIVGSKVTLDGHFSGIVITRNGEAQIG
jgi:NDP-sugar pyrophosphorylase family protein